MFYRTWIPTKKLRNISTLNREQSVVIENVTMLRNACMIQKKSSDQT